MAWPLAEEFHADQDSPFRGAEVLDEAVADAHLDPQMLSITGPF